MVYRIVIQKAAERARTPKSADLKKWALQALKKSVRQAEVTIRLVTPEEMTHLNGAYRDKHYATNVLSFPMTTPEELRLESRLSGDIAICANVVNEEALEQKKSNHAHWAHMVVHGIFHLSGYDHEKEADAIVMETLEIETLKELGFGNPYETLE